MAMFILTNQQSDYNIACEWVSISNSQVEIA